MELAGKRVLVIGGAGFVGSRVCHELVSRGADVTAFDDLSTGKAENLTAVEGRVRIVGGDIRGFDGVRNAVAGHDIVVHEAFPHGIVTRSVDQQYVEVGVLGTFNVLRAAVECEVEKVVYASSVAVYGQQHYVPLDEAHPANPFLPYGVTKYVGELYCQAFSNVYGIDTVRLRYFDVYGPSRASYGHGAVMKFLARVMDGEPPVIFGTGEQVRDYTYVDDIVSGTILAMEHSRVKGDVFNLGSGHGTRIEDLATKAIEISGKDLTPEFASTGDYHYVGGRVPYGTTTKTSDGYVDTREYVANIDKARRLIGYEPKTTLDEGMRKTLAWMQDNR